MKNWNIRNKLTPQTFSIHPFLLSDWFFCRPLVVATKPHAVHQLKLLHLNHSHIVCMCVFSQSCVPTDKGAHDFCLCFSVHFLWLWYMRVHIFVHLCVNIQTWLFVCVCVICNSRMDGKKERKRERILLSSLFISCVWAELRLWDTTLCRWDVNQVQVCPFVYVE